ncbi:hypothetical protein ACFQVA_02555 [Actinomadura keratinilytica]
MGELAEPGPPPLPPDVLRGLTASAARTWFGRSPRHMAMAAARAAWP